MTIYCAEHRERININIPHTGIEHTTNKNTCDSWEVVITASECSNRWTTKYYIMKVKALKKEYEELANIVSSKFDV